MKQTTGFCVECNLEGRPLGNVFKKLCVYHNAKRLSEKRPPRKRIPYKRKTTGEAELFREIWDARLRVCHNCKAPLGTEARACFFSHIKPKSTHPELRLDPLNIRLLCEVCHYAHDSQGVEKYNSLTQ